MHMNEEWKLLRKLINKNGGGVGSGWGVRVDVDRVEKFL